MALSPEEAKALGLEDAAPSAVPAWARQKYGAGESFGRGVRQGASLGFVDELGGAFQAGLQALTHGRTDAEGKPLSAGAVYDLARGENRQEEKNAKTDNPMAYGGGELVGGVLPGAVAGGSPIALGALGGAQGVGNTDAPLASADTALNATVGGGTGALLGWGLGKVGGAIKAAPEAARSAANRVAYASAGPMLRDFRLVGDTGAQQIGRRMLDKGAVPWFGNIRSVAARLEPLQEEAGQAVGKTIDALDEKLARLAGKGEFPSAAAEGSALSGPLPGAKGPAGFNPAKLADKMRSGAARGAPVERPLASTLSDEAGAVADEPGLLSFKRAEALKRSYDPKAKYETARPSEVSDLYRDIRKSIKGSVEEGAHALDPKLAADHIAAKDLYASLAPATEAASDRLLRTEANRYVTPSDYLTGAAAKAGGAGDIKAMAMAILNHQIRTRGASGAARAADAVGAGLERTGAGRVDPEMLAKFGALWARKKQEEDDGAP